MSTSKVLTGTAVEYPRDSSIETPNRQRFEINA
jgi:hypothetical protein